MFPILLEVKEKYRGIDSFAMRLMADILGIHTAQVWSRAGGDPRHRGDAPGQIKVESDADPSAGPWGTTFRITVPRHEERGSAV